MSRSRDPDGRARSGICSEHRMRLVHAYPAIDHTPEVRLVRGGMRMPDESALGNARALREFRAALAAAEAAPSAASVAALRQASVQLKSQLRAAYAAAGNPYGDDTEGLYRWIREAIGQRDWGSAEMQGDASMTN